VLEILRALFALDAGAGVSSKQYSENTMPQIGIIFCDFFAKAAKHRCY
jgi:hypothetical protein